MDQDGRMLNMGYVLVKLFFRRNAPTSATFMSHWYISVACFLRLQTPLAADLPCMSLHSLREEVPKRSFQAPCSGRWRAFRHHVITTPPLRAVVGWSSKFGIKIALFSRTSPLCVQLWLDVYP